MFSALKKLVSAKAAPPAVPAPPAAWKSEGNAALARGALQEAATQYLKGTTPSPGDPLAWLNLGYVQLELAQRDAARQSLQRAETLMPAQDTGALCDVWCLLGRERQEQHDWAGARTWFDRVVRAQPTHADAWHELGLVHDKLNDGEQALACLMRAVDLRPDFGEAMGKLSEIEFSAQRYSESLRWADQMLSVSADGPRVHFLRARPLWRMGQLADSLRSLDKGLAHGEDATGIYFRGILLAEMGRHEEAQASLDRSRELAVSFAGPLAGAAAGLSLRPAQLGELVGKAALLHDLGRMREALLVFDAALAIDAANAGLQLSRSYTLFLLGEYEAAWVAYEYRWDVLSRSRLNRRPDFGVPQWQGQPLDGRTIIVYHEQGLGDSIQFMRYIPLLAKEAETVLFYLPETLATIAADLPANCRLMRDGEGAPSADFACALLSLPRLFNTVMANIPAPVPYLRAQAAVISRWDDRLGPRRKKLRVGLAWSGNPEHINDFRRSIPLEEIRRIAYVDFEFFSLQKELRDSDKEAAGKWPALTHFGAELHSFMDTAAVACLMDVVVSVDTSVAHLAGALGRPLYLLLPFVPDWRWGLEGPDTPWYPTASLFRQPPIGQWAVVVLQVMKSLELMAQGAAFNADDSQP